MKQFIVTLEWLKSTDTQSERCCYYTTFFENNDIIILKWSINIINLLLELARIYQFNEV